MNQRSERLNRLAIMPIPLLVLAMVALWVADVRVGWPLPPLTLLIHYGSVALGVAFIVIPAARSFLATGQPSVLMLGCGILMMDVAVTAVSIKSFDLDTLYAIYNTSALLGALCHFTGVAITSRRKIRLGHSATWLTAVYAGGVAVIGLLIWSTFTGRMPVFFIEGQGGTLLRSLVVSTAVALFLLTAGLLWQANRRTASPFLYWYALGLVLLAAGLAGSMVIAVKDSPLQWVTRFTQVFATIYMCAAVLASAREGGPKGIPLAAVEEAWRENTFLASLRKDSLLGWVLRYSLAVVAAAVAMGLRLVLSTWVGPGLPAYVTFYPMVMVVALLAGFGPGLAATALAALTAAYGILPPVGQFAIASPVDRVGLVLFASMGLFISVVAELYRRNRDKAAAYDREAALRESQARLATFAEFLRLVNANPDVPHLVEASLRFFHGQSGCEAVGIRLRDGDDYPYYEARGFPEQFLRLEHSLCWRDEGGQLARDTAGNPVIECMCGNVICGRFDPSKPFFTPHGSFWTNGTTELLGSTTEADRQARGHHVPMVGNRCNGQGYESVALIALRCGEERLGLLQLNDRRRGLFTPEVIAFWERLAGHLAVALAHARAHEAMRQAKEDWEQTFNTVPDCVAVLDDQHRVVLANRAMAERLGVTTEQCVGLHCYEAVHGTTQPPAFCPHTQTCGDHREHTAVVHEPRLGGDFLVSTTPRLDAQGRFTGAVHVARDITERKRTEEALRERERLLQDVIDGSPSPIFLKDRDGKFITINASLERMLGISRDEIKGKTDYDIASKEAADYWRIHDTKVMAAGKAIQIEEEADLQDGHHIFLANKFPLVDAAGHVYGVGAISHDITERKRTEEALRESEAKYRNLFENITEEVHFWKLVRDEDGRIKTWRLVDANPPTLKTWGRTLDEIRGKTTDEIFGSGATQHYLPVVRKIMTEGVPFAFEDYFPNLDRHFRFTSVPLGDYFITTGADITSIKKAELALRESEERLRLLGDNLPDSAVYQYVHETDGSVRFVHISAGIERLNGVSVADVLRDAGTLHAQSPPEYVGRLIEAEARSKRELSDFDMELPMRRPDGEVRWMRLHSRPRRLPDGRTIWDGVQIDVTETKRAGERIRAALAEKEVLLKEIHHRVKNNMQVISSLVALQADRLQDGAMRAALQDVSHRVRSMALVHEKLYQSADMAKVEFAEYAQSLLNYLWRAHGATACGVRLATNLEPLPLSVNAAVPCGLILNELVSNALKHAFPDQAGGEVTVSLRGSPDGEVCLRVRDNGVGLPLGLDWRQAGSLGLRLVQMLAGQLHAAVEVAGGEGTEFTVTFGKRRQEDRQV